MTASSHRAVAGSAGRGRRRRPLRTAAIIAVSLLVLIAAGAGWFYLKLNGNITTFGADGVSPQRPAEGAGGQNILVIGSDSRSGGNSSLGGGDGDVGRSDTAFLLHIYGDSKHAVAVSIPRDTLVEIPPCRLPDGRWTKPQHNAMFNAAFSVGESAKGNPACTQNTVEKLSGVRVDHTVVVDFEGFSKMTSAVGGVPVCLPKDIYEGDLNPNRHSRGERIFAKGPQNVSGQQALDYVRIRHGIGDNSDIGRIQRQQAFVGSLIKKVKDQGFSPTTLLPLANAATQSMTVDPGLDSADKLLSFAMSLKDIDLHNTKFITLPWRYQGERVAIVHPAADTLWADIKADRTLDGKNAGGPGAQASPGPSPSPSGGPETGAGTGTGAGTDTRTGTDSAAGAGAGISVAVYNGTATTGLAARAADQLKSAGFTVTGTATARAQGRTATTVEYGAGKEAEAKAVAARFRDARLVPTTAPGAGVKVVLGTAYASRPSLESPAAATPSAGPSSGSSAIADSARSADDNICSGLSYG
ncbi:LytR family transcriptional regulator [Streptomyces albofaciens JCM 4342]|uniref:LCP family protein n=1 Tax=Streptomyces albofaciens TaxID=66866 RepID=UPI001238F1B2|nr:LCP family protein [Streptomyces albofaciens]KAA6215082.1 LytR family transcriptional regulator [Streptomyces albofaciens JCM 4342]